MTGALTIPQMCVQTIYIRKTQCEVPCGKCYECVKRRRNDWVIRCKIERQHSPYVYFVLLTYAKTDGVLAKRDIQLFLKRLRIRGVKLKYLIVGELGEKKGRPHWHCLFFMKERLDYALVSAAWHGGYDDASRMSRAGWVNISVLKSDRGIRYTVKYIYKYLDGKQKFIMLASKNPAIGADFLQNQTYFLERCSASFAFDGRKMALPRYYKRKFFDDYPDIKEKVNDELAAKVVENLSEEVYRVWSLHPEKKLHQIQRMINDSKHERERIEKLHERGQIA